MPLRRETKHFSIGSPGNLPANQLPTNRDVINYVRFMSGGKVHVRASDGIFKLVAEKVVDMWVSEGIPVILTNNVQRKVAACYKNFRNI